MAATSGIGIGIVGVVRSVDGNSSHISARLAAHRKAVFAVLRAGLAKGHKANPSACLRVESIFGMPVLLSGMSSLILSKAEENMLDLYYKVHIQRLLKLHQSTPAPVVHFLAGTLPLRAQLHLRMLSLFGQLCRLREGDNILAAQASGVYSSADPSSHSWFWKLRQVCVQYGLPHPASWLVSKPTKLQVKKVTKSAVLGSWLAQLREKAESLSSCESQEHCNVRSGPSLHAHHWPRDGGGKGSIDGYGCQLLADPVGVICLVICEHDN